MQLIMYTLYKLFAIAMYKAHMHNVYRHCQTEINNFIILVTGMVILTHFKGRHTVGFVCEVLIFVKFARCDKLANFKLIISTYKQQ